MYYKVAVFLFVFVIAIAIAQHENHQHHRVNVAVYYESLCPDSKKFITTQLYPSLQGNLSNFVNLTLVPYGKTKKNGDLYDCHHGPAECYGNKIHACALNLIDDGKSSEGLGYNKVALGFINCLMNKAVRNGNDATFPSYECAQLSQVNNLNLIDNCANHTDANQYVEEFGKMTDAVSNPLKSVPTIVFNKQYKKEDSDLAQTNFVKALCQYIHGEKPVECTRNSATSFAANFIFVVSTFLIARYLY